MYIYTYIDMCLCVWYFIPMVTLHAHKQICHAVLETFKWQDSHATNSSVLGPKKKKKKVRMFVLNETIYFTSLRTHISAMWLHLIFRGKDHLETCLKKSSFSFLWFQMKSPALINCVWQISQREGLPWEYRREMSDTSQLVTQRLLSLPLACL